METFSMETTARAVDWKAVETDYRTSNRSTRAIGATHDVSHTAVVQRQLDLPVATIRFAG